MKILAARILLAAALSLVVAVGGGVLWAWNAYHASGPLEASTTLIIPKGTGVQEIARLLQASGVIDNTHLFVLGTRYTEMARRMRAGEFAFPARIAMSAVAEHLVSGKLVRRRVTIPEGLLTREIIDIVRNTDGLTGAVSTPPEDGIFLPETYFFSYGDSRESILTRMRTAMGKAVAEAWKARNGKIAVKSAREALILASIIEKETGVAAERARVSAVFHNRLRRKMRLQSDPTVAYAVTGGGVSLGRPLTRADLEADSPFNTYRNAGLPPGPIANPGRASLIAAVRPLATREYYFVADGKGGHAFARTLREHNRNVAKWRRLKRDRAK